MQKEVEMHRCYALSVPRDVYSCKTLVLSRLLTLPAASDPVNNSVTGKGTSQKRNGRARNLQSRISELADHCQLRRRSSDEASRSMGRGRPRRNVTSLRLGPDASKLPHGTIAI